VQRWRLQTTTPSAVSTTRVRARGLGRGVTLEANAPAGLLSADGDSTMSPLLVVLGVGAALGAILVTLALVQLRGERRQLDALMGRLDRAESEARAPAAGIAPTPALERVPPVPGDVLAGRTSYVAAMVAGAGGDITSLSDKTILTIHARIEDSLTPGELALNLNVSLRTLERVLAATLQCTPRQLILTMKMREARRLIVAGNLRVGEVAFRLGFPSAAHFSTRFKRFYGTTPSSLQRAQHPAGSSRSGNPPASSDREATSGSGGAGRG
jgi:AraC-like DNA-binding protein